ncbi:MAG TPA: ribonuclease III [Candidatus Kapabacteria bacterium]|nr:ribonuclease III [Candidatus Kapabacteria bacterium]
MKNILLNIYNGLFKSPDLLDNDKSGFIKFHVLGILSPEKKLELESILGIKINNIGIFEKALIHRSYLPIINRPGLGSNERLEYFGDAILGFIITEHLFWYHRDELEGKLTKLRSWLVNKHSLAVCAKLLKLDKFIFLSHSAESSLKGGHESIVSDALEALIAAIYIDSGFEVVKNFIINKLLTMMLNEQLLEDKNFKSRLLERVQSEGYAPPTYQVIEELGPDHSKEFKIGVYVDSELKGIGEGKSKKEAEQNAAKNALENYITITLND